MVRVDLSEAASGAAAGQGPEVSGPAPRTEDEQSVTPCFTPGTLIATPLGERPVEDLGPGDQVLTRDNGLQMIRWVGRNRISGRELAAAPHLRPVLIRKDSLAEGVPERDMRVSPNHRMLVASDRTALYFREREVLAAAKHLIDNRGVHSLCATGADYIHFMFDRHELVRANGAWTESFQPGDRSLKGLGNAQRNEILELFPALARAQGIDGYLSARRILSRREARRLTE